MDIKVEVRYEAIVTIPENLVKTLEPVDEAACLMLKHHLQNKELYQGVILITKAVMSVVKE